MTLAVRALGMVIFISGLLALMVSCSSTDYAGYKYAPYSIRGVRYEPIHPRGAKGFSEIGIASHYKEGGLLRRGQTAIGERYSARAMAGAHKTLPIPCRVRVTNLENGRSVVVRINDRGPFIPGRVVDLTPAAAKQLGFYEKGLARVRVDLIDVGDGKYRVR